MTVVLGAVGLGVELLLFWLVVQFQRRIASEEDIILISRSHKMYLIIIFSVIVPMLNMVFAVAEGSWHIINTIVLIICIMLYVVGVFNFEVYTNREIIKYRKFIGKTQRLSLSEMKCVFIEMKKSKQEKDVVFYRIISKDKDVFEIQVKFPDINYEKFLMVDDLLESRVKFYTKENYDENIPLLMKRPYKVIYDYRKLMI